MWHLYQKTAPENIDLSESVLDLQQTISRKLIFIFGIGCFLWLVSASLSQPQYIPENGLVLLILITSCGLALYFLNQRFLVAQIFWIAGLAIAITTHLMIFRIPETGFLYSLLPLMTVVTLGWPAAVIVEFIIILGLSALAGPFNILALPSGHITLIGLGGALTTTAGWAATSTFANILEWFSYSYHLAQQHVEEARDQRLELKQIQEDLLLANREQARLSDRLKAMTALAEEALKAKEEFVANVSHELRTPLNMITGFTEMIVKSPRLYGSKLPPKLLADISAIQRNSLHLMDLVNDVLDLSQVEAGRMAITREWTDLKEIIAQAAEQVQPLFSSKALYLALELPQTSLHVFCDQTRIREVIVNLLSNAGRFTDLGGVTVCAVQEKDEIVVHIRDTGPGIAEPDQARVFEPFQQIDSSIRRKHGGSGLGLTICKRFVEMHQGKMWLESQQGQGTTFSFSLPVEAPPAPLGKGKQRWFNPYQSYDPRTRPFKAPIPEVTPRYVLLEEGETLLRLFRRYMNSVELVPVKTTAHALTELARSPAQALICNVPPGASHLITDPGLKELPFGTPILRCWIPGSDAFARELGVIRYLIKPVPSSELLEALAGLGNQVRSVLIADDEPEMLQLFSRILASAEQEYRVMQASDGQQAIEMVRERKPDAVLLDLMMPEKDGFEVVREMKGDESLRAIPVIIVSSRDPVGAPIVSDTLSVTRSGGLTLNDLMACTQMLGNLLAPGARPAGPVLPVNSLE